MKAIRIFAPIIALVLLSSIAFAGGEKRDRISAKFYKAKEVSTSNVAYCYLKASYRALDGDVHHFSQIIPVELNNWSLDKTEQVFSFEAHLSEKDPDRVYIASFSWISTIYTSENEANQARLKEMGAFKK